MPSILAPSMWGPGSGRTGVHSGRSSGLEYGDALRERRRVGTSPGDQHVATCRHVVAGVQCSKAWSIGAKGESRASGCFCLVAWRGWAGLLTCGDGPGWRWPGWAWLVWLGLGGLARPGWPGWSWARLVWVGPAGLARPGWPGPDRLALLERLACGLVSNFARQGSVGSGWALLAWLKLVRSILRGHRYQKKLAWMARR